MFTLKKNQPSGSAEANAFICKERLTDASPWPQPTLPTAYSPDLMGKVEYVLTV